MVRKDFADSSPLERGVHHGTSWSCGFCAMASLPLYSASKGLTASQTQGVLDLNFGFVRGSLRGIANRQPAILKLEVSLTLLITPRPA